MRTRRLIAGLISACALVAGVVATGTARADENTTRTVTLTVKNSSSGLILENLCATILREAIPMPGGERQCTDSLAITESKTLTFNVPSDQAGTIRLSGHVFMIEARTFRPDSIDFPRDGEASACVKLVGSLIVKGLPPLFNADPPKFVPC